MMDSFTKEMIKILSLLNAVDPEGAKKKGCRPFFVGQQQVGFIRADFWKHLQTYKSVFIEHGGNEDGNEKNVHLSPDFTTYETRTNAVNDVLEELRRKDVITALRGWRSENYKVCAQYTDEPVMEVERAGSGLFGFIQYGVHINGFTRDNKGRVDSVWIGRRSKSKQTFPDMYDNMCAGGLAVGLGVEECARKECQEEASVSENILKGLTFVQTISYFFEDERGLFPECQYVYDLEVPGDFQPVNADGEVGSFHKYSIQEVKTLMAGGNFKPNCVAVCLDFLIRHGIVTPDTDPYCAYYVEQMHAPLQTYFKGKL